MKMTTNLLKCMLSLLYDRNINESQYEKYICLVEQGHHSLRISKPAIPINTNTIPNIPLSAIVEFPHSPSNKVNLLFPCMLPTETATFT